MATVERTMTVNLRRHYIDTPMYKRAKKAGSALRQHIMQHMKATDVKIGKYLNLKMWERGIRNPAHKVTFIAKKDDKGVVYAEIANIPVKKQKPVKVKAAKKEEAAAKEVKVEKAAVAKAEPATTTLPAAAAKKA